MIDWFTVVAQGINFLVLVFLLQRFLYKPILRALDEREAAIALSLSEAEEVKTNAEAERDKFSQKNRQFDEEHARMLAEAKAEAKEERERLIAEARTAASAHRELLTKQINGEFAGIRDSIVQRTQEEVFRTSRKVLKDLASESLESRIVAAFLEKLQELDDAERARLSAGTSDDPAVVRSAFELEDELKEKVQSEIQSLVGQVQVEFLTSSDLIGGIEFTVHGQKVAWSIGDYMEALEVGLGALLTEDSVEEEGQA